MATTVTDPPTNTSAGEHLRARVVGGSAIMLLGSIFVGGMNLIYNFAIAHKLGAGQFGHASVTYTLLMLLSSVTLSFQLVCSKFVARSTSEGERAAIYHHLHRRAWIYSLSIGLLLAIASPEISRYLNLPTTVFLRLLAAGIDQFASRAVVASLQGRRHGDTETRRHGDTFSLSPCLLVSLS